MSILDAGLGAGLEESLKTLVPKALDHPDDRIAMLYIAQGAARSHPGSRARPHCCRCMWIA